jgi:oxygen-independent coproporphyrinogen-3 oxidase
MAFGLYLHFPFCANKCAYCDFYKELHDDEHEAAFYDALGTETQLVAEQYASGDNEIATIYVGGGTPSLSSLDRFRGWLDQLRSAFYVAPNIEFSFENNPESVTLELLTELRALGISRPTFGIQSFNQRLLRVLGRKHHPEDSQRAVYLANALGFPTFGVDMLFGLPGQGTRELSKDLDQLMDLRPPHISFYQLTVEPGTELCRKVAAGRIRMPDDNLLLALYKGGVETFEEHGYDRYEVSSFAKPGHECRHNIGYWQGQDYLALGPSGHSFMQGQRFANTPDLNAYVKLLSEGRRPLIEDKSGPRERMMETIMLGLRTAQGINRAEFEKRFGRRLEEQLDRKQYDLLIESGHLIPDRGRLRLSDEGILVADEITRRLVK